MLKSLLKEKLLYAVIAITAIIIILYIYLALDMETVGNLIQEVNSQEKFPRLMVACLIFLLRSISIIIPIIPGTYCSILSGYFFGFKEGLLVIFIADLLACSSSFTLSRRFGRGLIRKLVGKRFMKRVEGFSKKHLERNFFLMTSFLMSNFFDFVCYGVGLTKVTWKKFLPALIFSIVISDAPFVASGHALRGIGDIQIKEILNGNIKSLQGSSLIIFISSIIIIFGLAILNIFLQKRYEYFNSKQV